MDKTTSRRLFMRNSAFAFTGIAVLGPTLVSAFAPENPFMGYNPYAESKSDLRCGYYNDTAISVKGTILNEDGSSPVGDALVEVWHLSPNSSSYRHRTKLTTDGNGQYHFITDFPNREKGKCARIYFKVSKNDTTIFTELLLNSVGPQITHTHWKDHHKLGDRLMPKKEVFLDQTTIHFNISI